MYRSFYEGMELAHLPLFTLLLFLAMFFGVVIRVLVFRKRDELDSLAAMPLQDSKKDEV